MHKKCPFSVPSVPGVDGKRKREEDERRRNQMSIEEQSYSPPKKEVNKTSSYKGTSASLLKDSLNFDEKFCFEISQPVADSEDVYWEYDLSSQVTGEYARTLIFREQQYFVRSETGTPSQTLFICVPGIYGMKNERSEWTNRVCALHLTAISSLIDDSSKKVYDLLYKQTHDIAIDIPMDLTTLRFEIYEDKLKRNGDLGAPLICQFDVRHHGK